MYKDLKTTDPKILVHITYARQSDGRTILRGYAVDAGTKIRVDGAKTIRRTAACDAMVPAAEALLTNAVMAGLVGSAKQREVLKSCTKI